MAAVEELHLGVFLKDILYTSFKLPMSKEDSKSSRRRQHRHFLKPLYQAKHLQDNLGKLWELSRLGFGFVLRGH